MPNLIVLYSFLLNRYLLSSVHLGVRSCVRSKLWAWILNHPSLGLARLRWPKNCRSKQWHLHHLHSWCRISAKSIRKNCIDEPPIQRKWDRLRKGVICLVQRCVCFRMIDLLDQPPGSKRLNFFLETIVSQGKRIESPGVFTNECIYNDMSKANWLYRFKSACYLKKQERFKNFISSHSQLVHIPHVFKNNRQIWAHDLTPGQHQGWSCSKEMSETIASTTLAGRVQRSFPLLFKVAAQSTCCGRAAEDDGGICIAILEKGKGNRQRCRDLTN